MLAAAPCWWRGGGVVPALIFVGSCCGSRSGGAAAAVVAAASTARCIGVRCVDYERLDHALVDLVPFRSRAGATLKLGSALKLGRWGEGRKPFFVSELPPSCPQTAASTESPTYWSTLLGALAWG